jgi:gluconokinase
MGVAGCGKSSLAGAVASLTGLTLIEGDDFHSPDSVAKMRAGMALTDGDRVPWLARLGAELTRHPGGAILACSALKRGYRQQLREAVPDLKFVFLEIERDTALTRVAARGDGHPFPASLVDSQFAALEPPTGEPGVLTLRATQELSALSTAVFGWMTGQG